MNAPTQREKTFAQLCLINNNLLVKSDIFLERERERERI